MNPELNASSASGIGGTARSVEVPEVEPPRSGIDGATDGPTTSPNVGEISIAKQLFGGSPRRPEEGRIIRTPEGYEFHLHYDEAMIARIVQRSPWLLPELLAELERSRR